MPIAGSSAGSEDFTPALMEGLGDLLVHGITVMPGKPVLLAADRSTVRLAAPPHYIAFMITIIQHNILRLLFH
jgi:putative molybdopterin biosynthesis protein